MEVETEDWPWEQNCVSRSNDLSVTFANFSNCGNKSAQPPQGGGQMGRHGLAMSWHTHQGCTLSTRQ